MSNNNNSDNAHIFGRADAFCSQQYNTFDACFGLTTPASTTTTRTPDGIHVGDNSHSCNDNHMELVGF